MDLGGALVIFLVCWQKISCYDKVGTFLLHAVVAELADALDSGSSEGNFMEVQVLSTAPINTLCGSGGMADAPAWGAGGGNLVMVQIHSTAPKKWSLQNIAGFFVFAFCNIKKEEYCEILWYTGDIKNYLTEKRCDYDAKYFF